LLLAQFSLGWHLQVGVGPANGLDQKAFLGVAGDDGGPSVAALEQARAGIQVETAFELVALGAVAVVAPFDQHGADAFLEQLEASRAVGGLGLAEDWSGQHKDQAGGEPASRARRGWRRIRWQWTNNAHDCRFSGPSPDEALGNVRKPEAKPLVNQERGLVPSGPEFGFRY